MADSQQNKTFLDSFAENAPSYEESGEADGEDDQGKKGQQNPQVDQTALLQQIATLNERVERAERTNAALMAQPMFPSQSGANGQPQQPAQPQPLPDPTVDPDAFNQALSDRVSSAVGQAISTQQAHQQQNATQEQQVDYLWRQFGEQYPELAKHEKLVRVAAQDVTQDMRMRGVDINRYMFGAPERFLADVAEKMKKDFEPVVTPQQGQDGQGQAAASGQPAGQGTQAPAQGQDDPARTAGIFGGMESGGAPSAGAKAEEKPGSLTNELQSMQKKDGYL